MQIDPYIAFLFGLGAMVLLASWAPLGLKRLPLPMTLPIVCVALGVLLFGNNVFTAVPARAPGKPCRAPTAGGDLSLMAQA